MRSTPHVLAALLVLGWLSQGSAAADPIVIGSAIGSGSCVPFGCSVVTRSWLVQARHQQSQARPPS